MAEGEHHLLSNNTRDRPPPLPYVCTYKIDLSVVLLPAGNLSTFLTLFPIADGRGRHCCIFCTIPRKITQKTLQREGHTQASIISNIVRQIRLAAIQGNRMRTLCRGETFPSCLFRTVGILKVLYSAGADRRTGKTLATAFATEAPTTGGTHGNSNPLIAALHTCFADRKDRGG